MIPWASTGVQGLFKLSSKPVDWTLAARLLAVEAKPLGVVALARAEVAEDVKGVAALTAEALSIQDYCASRTLAVEVLLGAAVSRCGVFSVADRRALGVAFSASSLMDKGVSAEAKDRNGYAVVARALRAGAADGAPDFRAVMEALEAEVRTVLASLSEEDRQRGSKPAPEGYDAGCSDATFSLIGGLAASAVASLPPSGDAVAPLLLPALRADASAPAAKAAAPTASKGFGAAAAAAGPRMPDFGAVLKRQSRFTFPELQGWGGAEAADDLIVSQEAVACLVDLLLKMPLGRLHCALPGAFLARSLSLGCAAFTPQVSLGSADAPPPEGVLDDPAATLIIAAFLPSTTQMHDAAALLRMPRRCRTVIVPIMRLKRSDEGRRDEALEELQAAGRAMLATTAGAA